MERVAFQRGPTVALVLGGLGLAVGVIAGLGQEFYQSWLLAFLFWSGLALGHLIMLAVGHMAGGSWSAMILRPLEAGVSLLPIMALFFIPVLFGMNALYVWTNPTPDLEGYKLITAKLAYLNVPFFMARAGVYFALWILAAWLFLRASAKQDRNPDDSAQIAYRIKAQSGLWVVVYVLTMTFAGRDWAMSLTPAWWSGIYSVILMISQAITAVAFTIIVMVVLARRSPAIDALLTRKRLQDLGNFLMAFTMFWAYVSFSQLIIIWSGNITELAPWYTARLADGWNAVAGFLLAFGFLAPFIILFSRWVKQDRRALVIMAGWALAVQMLNLVFFIVPTYGREGFPITLTDVAVWVGIGGLWMFFYLRRLSAHPILPINDPRLKGAKPHG